MNSSTLRMMAAFLLCNFCHLTHAQMTVDSTEDHTYGKGMKKTKTIPGNQFDKSLKELVIEEYYDGSEPRKLMAIKRTTKNLDGSIEISNTEVNPKDGYKKVKVEKKDFAGTPVMQASYTTSSTGRIMNGKKWEIDDSGNKQEYEWDGEDEYWMNKKDEPTFEKDSTEDHSYGKGYKMTFTAHNLKSAQKQTIEKYYKFPDDLMQQNETIVFKDGSSHTKTIYLKDGKAVKVKSVKKDVLGNVLSESESVPHSLYNTEPLSGTRWQLDSSNNKIYFKWDRKKGQWVETEKKENKEAKPDIAFDDPNKLALGPAWMHFGDKDFHYGSIGFTADFTHMLGNKTGITGDIGVYWHKESGESGSVSYSQNYGQYNITAGVTWLPLPTTQSPFVFSTHALAGVSIYHIKSATEGYGSSSSSEESFTLNIGAEEEYRVNNRFGLGLQLNYAPTFFFHSTQNNIRVDVQATLRL